MKGKIYKIYNEELNLTYYGSSTNNLSTRFNNHKSSLTGSSKRLFESGNPKILLLEEIEYENKCDLLKRERYYIENNDCVNVRIPSRNIKEWLELNKEKIKDYSKIYRSNNKDKIKKYITEYKKVNYEKIKTHANEVISCECGLTYTRGNKFNHFKTHHKL